ncbi:glutamate--tRNA ligase family protein [Mucilaginibacter ginsenosidivorans]|uniref:tRNA glutamyl-Q synthetase n=1 Tax=Mucilaginibacter ginsenosidivorans TaxID=398053 RepID=A0A5B8UST3_9SPHI|nr:glutamate--tRNA ligase family protein [Mucilaginibacter ginsenosidivorans]QEC62167.1 tRNA glutamyl-Q synthetase [Mucilaginibacter ginsenosidivorans]
MDTITAKFNKTRIAPTPSGFLHLGNVLSFAITAYVAEQTGAKILLRIDDLDRDRVNPEYVQDIFDTLNFMDIPWHEGPRNLLEFESEYSQVHRMDIYRGALKKLEENNAVFACTCSRSQIRQNNPDETYPGTCRNKGIPLDTPDASWRIKTGAQTELAIKTLNNGVQKATLPANMYDFVVRKKDGFPAYQLASVIDDIHFGIDLVIRGQDLFPSTLAQLYLANKLEANIFTNNTFHHHPLLTEKGKKLSKSSGDTSIHYLRKLGKKPADIYNQVAGAAGLHGNISNWRELGQRFWH